MRLTAASLLASIQGDWRGYEALCRREPRRSPSELGDPVLAREALLTLGRARIAEGDEDGALQLFDEAEQAAVARATSSCVGLARFNAGYLELTRGDYPQAEVRLQAAHAVLAGAGHHHGAARSLAALGSVALHEHRTADAVERLRESIELANRVGDRGIMAWALELLGDTLAETEPQRAARLLGAAEALREALESTLEGIELALHEQALASLEPADVRDAWASGRALSPDDAAAFALSGLENASYARSSTCARSSSPTAMPLGPSRFSIAPAGNARTSPGAGSSPATHMSSDGASSSPARQPRQRRSCDGSSSIASANASPTAATCSHAPPSSHVHARRIICARGTSGSSQSSAIRCCRCDDCERPCTASSSAPRPPA